MKNLATFSWLAAALLMILPVTSRAQEPAAKPVVNSHLEKVQATVTAIDPDTRAVKLNGPKGPVQVVVAPDVRNFDKLHVGDKVAVSYYEGIAAQMTKGGTKVTAPAESTFTTPAKNGKPGGGVGESVTSMVTIEAVDKPTNTVAFKRSDGSVHIIEARAPNMREFIRTLKSGDVVEVTYTESVAVDVTPSS